MPYAINKSHRDKSGYGREALFCPDRQRWFGTPHFDLRLKNEIRKTDFTASFAFRLAMFQLGQVFNRPQSPGPFWTHRNAIVNRVETWAGVCAADESRSAKKCGRALLCALNFQKQPCATTLSTFLCAYGCILPLLCYSVKITIFHYYYYCKYYIYYYLLASIQTTTDYCIHRFYLLS